MRYLGLDLGSSPTPAEIAAALVAGEIVAHTVGEGGSLTLRGLAKKRNRFGTEYALLYDLDLGRMTVWNRNNWTATMRRTGLPLFTSNNAEHAYRKATISLREATTKEAYSKMVEGLGLEDAPSYNEAKTPSETVMRLIRSQLRVAM